MAAGAVDHLDAPGLTPPGGDLRLDITDVYAFRSPKGKSVLVMNVNGLRGGTAGGGGGGDLISVTTGEGMTVTGGLGGDTIDSRNQSHDKIDCGPGKDTLYADAKDTFKGCETVTIK